MIFDDKPLSQMDFPCMVSSFRYFQRRMASGIITSPRKIRSEKGTRYLFQIGQLVLVFFVSKNDTPEWLRDAAIIPEGEMRIVHFDDKRGETLMKNLFGPIVVQALSLAAAGNNTTFAKSYGGQGGPRYHPRYKRGATGQELKLLKITP